MASRQIICIEYLTMNFAFAYRRRFRVFATVVKRFAETIGIIAVFALECLRQSVAFGFK